MKMILPVIGSLVVFSGALWAQTNPTPQNTTVMIHGQELSEEETKQLVAKLGGIGLAIKVISEGVLVEKVSPDSPACRAGMKAGDIVTEIDSKSVKGLQVREISDRMRGPIGSEVVLTVVRKGQTEPASMKLVRQEIWVQKDNRTCD